MSDTRANHTAKRQVKWGQNEEETYSFLESVISLVVLKN